MDVVEIALERRHRMLEEIRALDQFIEMGNALKTLDRAATQGQPLNSGPVTHAYDVLRTTKIDRAAFQRMLIEDHLDHCLYQDLRPLDAEKRREIDEFKKMAKYL